MKFEWIETPDGPMVRGIEGLDVILLSREDIRDLNAFLKGDSRTLTSEDIDYLCAWDITPKDKDYRPDLLGC